LKDRIERKEIKRMGNDCECKGERGKELRERRNDIIYTKD
jgi:hypothetical protein